MASKEGQPTDGARVIIEEGTQTDDGPSKVTGITIESTSAPTAELLASAVGAAIEKSDGRPTSPDISNAVINEAINAGYDPDGINEHTVSNNQPRSRNTTAFNAEQWNAPWQPKGPGKNWGWKPPSDDEPVQ